jgi:hypothetical protein
MLFHFFYVARHSMIALPKWNRVGDVWLVNDWFGDLSGALFAMREIPQITPSFPDRSSQRLGVFLAVLDNEQSADCHCVYRH